MQSSINDHGRWRRFATATCLVVLVAAGGCDFVIRNEPDVNVRRLAETWPPYRPPVVMNPGTGERVSNLNQDPVLGRQASQIASPPVGTSTTARSSRVLIPIRRAEEWDLPETAIDSLGRIGAPAVPALIEALEHRDPIRRVQAATVLARIGPEAQQSVPALVELLDDEYERVRKAAARALGQIGPAAEDAVLPLLEIIEKQPTGNTGTQRGSVQPASATEPIQ